jgi:hypothetical protein
MSVFSRQLSRGVSRLIGMLTTKDKRCNSSVGSNECKKAEGKRAESLRSQNTGVRSKEGRGYSRPSSLGCLLEFIGFVAMPDRYNIYSAFIVMNSIDHTVVTNANPPQIFLSLYLPGPQWTRPFCQRFDFWKDLVNYFRVEPF